MTRKVIILEFVVPTVLAIGLGILLSIGAVHLMNQCLSLSDQPEDHYSVAGNH
jgi:hypothetical protein